MAVLLCTAGADNSLANAAANTSVGYPKPNEDSHNSILHMLLFMAVSVSPHSPPGGPQIMSSVKIEGYPTYAVFGCAVPCSA